jgi:hypothetical protein
VRNDPGEFTRKFDNGVFVRRDLCGDNDWKINDETKS